MAHSAFLLSTLAFRLLISGQVDKSLSKTMAVQSAHHCINDGLSARVDPSVTETLHMKTGRRSPGGWDGC